MKNNNDSTYDVVIYHIDTRRVEKIVGKNMKRHGRYNSAERRLDTALSRINDDYYARIVPSGKCKVGNVLPEVP